MYYNSNFSTYTKRCDCVLTTISSNAYRTIYSSTLCVAPTKLMISACWYIALTAHRENSADIHKCIYRVVYQVIRTRTSDLAIFLLFPSTDELSARLFLLADMSAGRGIALLTSAWVAPRSVRRVAICEIMSVAAGCFSTANICSFSDLRTELTWLLDSVGGRFTVTRAARIR